MQHAEAPHEDETVACAATAASAAVGAWCQSRSQGMSSSGWHVMRGECTPGHKSPRLQLYMSRTSHQMSRTLPDVPICHLELAHICPGQAESGIFEAQSGISLVACTTHTEPGNGTQQPQRIDSMPIQVCVRLCARAGLLKSAGEPCIIRLSPACKLAQHLTKPTSQHDAAWRTSLRICKHHRRM